MRHRQRFQKFPPMRPNFPLSPQPIGLPPNWWGSSGRLLVGVEQEQFWGHLCCEAYQKVVTAEYIHLTPWDSVVPPHHVIQVFLGVLFQETFPVEDQWTSLLRWHHCIRCHRLIAGQGFLILCTTLVMRSTLSQKICTILSVVSTYS
jgi:hypothetical protein